MPSSILTERAALHHTNRVTDFYRDIPKHFDFVAVIERTIAQKMKQRLGPKFEYGPPSLLNGSYSQHVAPECRLKNPVAIYKDPSLDNQEVKKALDEAVEEVRNTNKPKQETLPKNASVVTINLSHASNPELEIKTLMI